MCPGAIPGPAVYSRGVREGVRVRGSVMATTVKVLYWSHDERRVFVRVSGRFGEYEQWEPVKYDDDGRGWIETGDGWVCVFA